MDGTAKVEVGLVLHAGGVYYRLHRADCRTIPTMVTPPKPITTAEARKRRSRRCKVCRPLV